jgi:hypothetical protein
MMTSTKSTIPARQIGASQADFRAPGANATADDIRHDHQLKHTPIWMDEAYSYFVSKQPWVSYQQYRSSRCTERKQGSA